MSEFWGFSLNRTVCDVLTEMRTMDTKRNYSMINSHIEEIQVLANRMESKLYEYKEVRQGNDHIKKLKAEIKELETKREQLRREHKASNPGTKEEEA